MALATTGEAVERIGRGEMVIVVDDDGDSATGDLVLAAEFAESDAINQMMRVARGTMCVALTPARVDELGLTPMSPDGWGGGKTAFAVSVDARWGMETGDTARDRALTIQTLIDPDARPEYLTRPGHVFPIRAAEGGVLKRVGHTEAAVDLARLAGLTPAGVTAQILRDDGSSAEMEELLELGDELGIAVTTIADLIRHRSRTEKLVSKEAEASLPTLWGEFRAIIYVSAVDQADYVAVVSGDLADVEAPLVRVHSGCVTGDILGSLKCDCGWQLHSAFERIACEPPGVVLYIASHEGRGIGLVNKIRAYHLQECGLDTVEANEALGFPADRRDYGVGAQVLADLGISKMRLMSNNPSKFTAMEAYGLEVVERVPLEAPQNGSYERYLCTKRDKMGHMIRRRDDEAGAEGRGDDDEDA
ncbi:MAG: GTP cyclohydrolase II [Armatimonadota bacterium]|jgi:3,4-dihydroxy 2-butanone 4-phosphate synthase/GTP cyclohydrolase II